MDKFAESIRLAGENHWLMLTLGQANPRWPQDSNYDQQVVWSLGGRGRDHGANARRPWPMDNKSYPRLSGAGLTRTRLVGSDRVESDLVIAADSLRFRYLNGQRWQATWNSSSEKRLPDAIEITLGITADAELRTWVIKPLPCKVKLGEPNDEWLDSNSVPASRILDANRAGHTCHTNIGGHYIFGTNAGRIPGHAQHDRPIGCG